MKDTVITIGRQFGSGGRTIGKKLADRLGIPFYDKELIKEAAKKSGLSQSMFEYVDEKAVNSLLYSMALGMYSATNNISMVTDMPLNDKLFQIQADVIRDLANSPCVIVGRCADYVLRKHPNCLNVFIHAGLEERVDRAINEYHYSPNGIREALLKTDRHRANYYNYYSDQSWGDASNYHISLDSGALGVDNCVEIILRAIELGLQQRTI